MQAKPWSLVVFCLLSVNQFSAAAQTVQNRIVGPLDENRVTTLLGNVHPMARGEFDQGIVDPRVSLDRMIIQLRPSAAQQAALNSLLDAQNDPRSPEYHRWLTPAEYGARFGVSSADIARITGWLTAHGFRINEVAPGRRQIIFSGNAAQVEDTFHTQIHHFQANGVRHIANTQDPQIPTSMTGVISGIVSLHDFRSVSEIRSREPVKLHPEFTSGAAHYLFPADFAAIYDLNPLYKAGTTGAGTSIAIVGRSNINLQDVSKFRSTAGLSPLPPRCSSSIAIRASSLETRMNRHSMWNGRARPLPGPPSNLSWLLPPPPPMALLWPRSTS
jgi:hypothetical protein